MINYEVFDDFLDQKDFFGLEIKIPQTEENDEIINQAESANLDYSKRYGYYRLSIYERI